MTNAVAIALLSSLTLFLGLSALARRRTRAQRPSLSGVLALFVGAVGAGWMTFLVGPHAAASVLLIGVLGYCFGHFTTQRPTPSRLRSPEEKLG